TCHALRRLDRFRGFSLKTWASRVTERFCISLTRGWRSHESIEDPLFQALPSAQPGPLALLLMDEDMGMLHASIQKLPPKMQFVVLLDLEGTPNAAIADLLGITERAARWRRKRAHALLHKMLAG